MNRIPISFTKAAKGALAFGHKDVYQKIMSEGCEVMCGALQTVIDSVQPSDLPLLIACMSSCLDAVMASLPDHVKELVEGLKAQMGTEAIIGVITVPRGGSAQETDP